MMVTVMQKHTDADAMVYDYYVEGRQEEYSDTGHIVLLAMGGMSTWRAINDNQEVYLKKAVRALVTKRDQNGGVYPQKLTTTS